MANYKKNGAGSRIAVTIAILLLGAIIGFCVIWGTGYAITGNANPAQWQASVNTVINGKDGADGKNGVDGKDGANGQTPHIGENGNWCIGETDTGVKAAGADGANGQDGTKLYKHSITAEKIGNTQVNVYFVIYSSDSEPYTANTLPAGVIVSAQSFANSELPLNVVIGEDNKAEITILNVSGSTPYTMHYKAETITDTVTEV